MPNWIIIVFAVVVALAVAVAWIRRDSSDELAGPGGPTIDEDALVEQLDALGVDLVREQTPPPDLLAPMIRHDETLLDATRAKIDERKALLALLDDRLVSIEATLGRMGAQARVIPIASIESVKHRTDLGGELTIVADGETHDFTHIPLRKFDRFVGSVRELTSA